MSRLIVDVLDPEEQAAKNASVVVENAARERVRLAAKNRAAGHPEPTPGDRFYVQLQIGLSQRSRAGVVFVANKRTVVEIVEDGGAPEKRDPNVDAYVTPARAEEILADTALTVGARSGGEVDAAKLRAEVDRLETENKELREAARVRDARMGAEDAGDGKPARLRAARAARGSDDSGFGGEKG